MPWPEYRILQWRQLSATPWLLPGLCAVFWQKCVEIENVISFDQSNVTFLAFLWWRESEVSSLLGSQKSGQWWFVVASLLLPSIFFLPPELSHVLEEHQRSIVMTGALKSIISVITTSHVRVGKRVVSYVCFWMLFYGTDCWNSAGSGGPSKKPVHSWSGWLAIKRMKVEMLTNSLNSLVKRDSHAQLRVYSRSAWPFQTVCGIVLIWSNLHSWNSLGYYPQLHSQFCLLSVFTV